MPYFKSRSRKDFEKAIDDHYNCVNDVNNKVEVSYHSKQIMMQSFYFSASAAIENYLQNLFDDWIYVLKNRKASFKEIPLNVRTKHVLEGQKDHFADYLRNKDEKKVLDRLNIKNQYYEAIVDDFILPSYFGSNKILYQNKYPSVKNIKKIFIRLGNNDVYKTINSIGRKDYKSILESFLSIRENIAHSTPDDLTIGDVENSYKQLKDFIYVIDRALQRIIGTKYWTR